MFAVMERNTKNLQGCFKYWFCNELGYGGCIWRLENKSKKALFQMKYRR